MCINTLRLCFNQAMHVHDLSRDPPKTDERVSERMAGVGKALNSKPHGVQVGPERRVTCTMAAGVEVRFLSRHSSTISVLRKYQVHFDPTAKLFYASNLHNILPPDHYIPKTSSSSSTSLPANPHHRLRPEFLAHYPHPLSSDAFTPQSGASRRERENNDAEVERASKVLREIWIPNFVRKLDALEIRVVDSRGLVGEMHAAGVNVRYLGECIGTTTSWKSFTII